MNTVPFSELTAALAKLPERPAAFVLGSGLGPVMDRVKQRLAVGFADLPGMVAPTVAGHGGALILGDWASRPVLVFSGRLHFYEGHPWSRVVRPMELLSELGTRLVVLTNASGGIAERLAPGSLMALTDHLEWNHPKCWNTPGPGQRPAPYSTELNVALMRASAKTGVPLHQGIYAVVTGPTYESPAEIRALQYLKADAVGMSTAAEAKHANELGMPVVAISCIANKAAGLSKTPLSHKEVLHAVASSASSLGNLLEEFVRHS
jgi:purine-nucleoside phosphorylase